MENKKEASQKDVDGEVGPRVGGPMLCLWIYPMGGAMPANICDASTYVLCSMVGTGALLAIENFLS
jgi:hypothetical protein